MNPEFDAALLMAIGRGAPPTNPGIVLVYEVPHRKFYDMPMDRIGPFAGLQPGEVLVRHTRQGRVHWERFGSRQEFEAAGLTGEEVVEPVLLMQRDRVTLLTAAIIEAASDWHRKASTAAVTRDSWPELVMELRQSLDRAIGQVE